MDIDNQIYIDCLKKVTNLACKGVALDIGAGRGYMTSFLYEKGFDVHVFEPFHGFFKELDWKYKHNNNVFLNKLALSDTPNVIPNALLYNEWTIAEADNISIDLPVSDNNAVTGNFHVCFAYLDNYYNFNNFGTVDFMSIHTDGYEYKILKGAEKVLFEYSPIILLQLSYMIKSMGDDPVEMLDYLEDRGYEFYSMDGEKRSKNFVIENFPWLSSCDIVCIP